MGHPLESRQIQEIEPGDRRQFHLIDISDKPAAVLWCRGFTYYQCSAPSERVIVPAYTDLPLTNPSISVREYVIVTKPEEVILEEYTYIDGATSTFHVHSGITFEGPAAR